MDALLSLFSVENSKALMQMFMWTIFGLLVSILNCDMRRLLQQNNLVFHAIGYTCVVFLMGPFDHDKSAAAVWLHSLFVYAFFVMLTKTKPYGILAVLAAMFAIQMLQRRRAQDDADADAGRLEAALVYATYAIVVVGVAHSVYASRADLGDAFSLKRFFLHNELYCKV
jgi:predicted membrane protein